MLGPEEVGLTMAKETMRAEDLEIRVVRARSQDACYERLWDGYKWKKWRELVMQGE